MASSTGTAMKLFVIQESYKKKDVSAKSGEIKIQESIAFWFGKKIGERERERDSGGASEKVSGWSLEF